ncbi:Uncharacterised protein [Mycobacteroides abscessus subsp. abscessus]|nr:Uncharacterised protein [Mycobacteroides abscessus subsp. abscessus]
MPPPTSAGAPFTFGSGRDLSAAGYGDPHGGPSGDTAGENGCHTGDSTNVARHLLTPDPHWLSPSQPLVETLIGGC